MIKFGMGNTLITFIDEFYEYGGSTEVEDKGLTIGGYESAWLADLVQSYILEMTKQVFEKCTNYYGFYRDDGIVILKGQWSNEEINSWLKTFQFNVNDLLNSDHVQFTVEIWNPEALKSEKPRNKEVKINRKSRFPYLDTETYWYKETLAFRVHFKDGQLLKHVSKDSTHTKVVFHHTNDLKNL